MAGARLRIAVGLVSALLGSASAAFAQTVADPVVAMRGDDQITVSGARTLLAAADQATRDEITATPSGLRDFLRNVLLQRAILAEAEAHKWSDRPDIAAALKRLRDQAVVQSWLAVKTQLPPDYPNESDIATAYEQNKQRFLAPRLYHIAQLYVVAGAATKGAAKAKLAGLRRDISRGRVSFDHAGKADGSVAYNDLGWVPEDRIVEPVKSSVKGLPDGMISDAICTPAGCHLIELIATRPAGPAPLAEVRDQLVKALRQQRRATDQRAYADTMLKRDPVQVNEIELTRMLTASPK